MLIKSLEIERAVEWFLRRDDEDGRGYSDKGFDTFVCSLILSKSNKTKEEMRGDSIQRACEERWGLIGSI